MSQSGLRGSKMIQNDHYNMFLTIWRHFGPIWTFLNHFRQNLIFCLKNTKCFLAKVIWGKKSSLVWNDLKESKWAQNGVKWSKTCYNDHFGSFQSKLDILPQMQKVILGHSDLEQEIKFCLKYSKRVQMAPNYQKHVVLIIRDYFGPFQTTLGHRLACHFWPKGAFLDPTAHMIKGCLPQINFVYV